MGITPDMGYHPAPHMFPATALHIPVNDHKRPDFLGGLVDHDSRKDHGSPTIRREENGEKTNGEDKKEPDVKMVNGSLSNGPAKSGGCCKHLQMTACCLLC